VNSRGIVVVSLVVLVALAGTSGCSVGGHQATLPSPGVTAGAPTAPAHATETGWQVKRVVDGDTILVTRNGSDERVRFAGIDTPETVKANTPIQCYGPQASAETHTLLDGQTVLLESDPTQPTYDQYNRRLAHVWTTTSTGHARLLVSWYLVRNGFAHARTYGTPTSWQSTYEAAQSQARRDNLGFWSPTTCNGDTKKPA
jgi:micrococcal nuclease